MTGVLTRRENFDTDTQKTMWRWRKKMATYKSRRKARNRSFFRPLRRNQLCWTLIWASHLQNCKKNKFLLFKPVIFNKCAVRIFKICNTWLFSQGHWILSFPWNCQIKMTTANIIAIWCEWIKIIPFFCQMGKKYIFWCAAQFQQLVYMCHKIKKVENHWFKPSTLWYFVM